MKAKTIKLLEEKLGEYPHDLGGGRTVLSSNRIQKGLTIKFLKKDKFDYIY